MSGVLLPLFIDKQQPPFGRWCKYYKYDSLWNTETKQTKVLSDETDKSHVVFKTYFNDKNAV